MHKRRKELDSLQVYQIINKLYKVYQRKTLKVGRGSVTPLEEWVKYKNIEHERIMNGYGKSVYILIIQKDTDEHASTRAHTTAGIKTKMID